MFWGTKKRIFTICPSGKLKLASTNRRIILTGLTDLWWAIWIKINHYSLIIRSIWKTALHPQKFIRSLKKSLKKIQDFNGIWTGDLAILARPSDQLRYEATDVGSRSIVCSQVPVKEMKCDKCACNKSYNLWELQKWNLVKNNNNWSHSTSEVWIRPKNFTYQGKLRMQTDQTRLSLHTDVYLI